MTLVAENVSPKDGIVTPFVMLESHGDVYSPEYRICVTAHDSLSTHVEFLRFSR